MIKRDPILLEYLFNTPKATAERKEYFECDYIMFCLYYFPNEFYHDLARFHHQYGEALQKSDDIFFVWFRECVKTVLLRYYYIYCICYRRKRYIMHYNSNHKKAKKMLLDLAIIMEKNKRIIRDFWHLYIPAEGRSQRDPTKKSIEEFITTNQIMVKAMSMGMSPRGETFYASSGETFRPDLVAMDDIDTKDNVSSDTMIADDIDFILSEVFGWVDAFCQKIFLWNVINEDGRIPRLKKHFQSNVKSKMQFFWIPIREKGKIVWSRFVATDKEADELNKNIANSKAKYISLEKKRSDQWTIGYNQNFNLIAYKKWQRIIKDSHIKYYHNLPNHYKVVIGIDPAFSLKTNTDPIGIVCTAHHEFQGDKYKYVLEMMKLIEDEKDEDRFCSIVVWLYQKYKVSMVYIEGNNWGGVLARMLQKRGLSVVVLTSKSDKVTRLRERQAEIEKGLVQFNPEPSKTEMGIQQLKNFPGDAEDDVVDAFVNSLEEPEGWFKFRAV